MGDWWTTLIGLAGVVVGAAGGFIAVRWQHKAQELQQIRAKIADMIFTGDRYTQAISLVVALGVSDPPEVQNARRDHLEATLRYLEITANKQVYAAALDYWDAVSSLGWPESSPEAMQAGEQNDVQARDALMAQVRK